MYGEYFVLQTSSLRGKEGGSEGGRGGGREGGRDGGREGGKEGGMEGGREGKTYKQAAPDQRVNEAEYM